MRILHWLDLWWREVGGPLRSVSELASAMRDRGHEVTIATADPRDAPPAWLEGPSPRLVVLRHGVLGRIARTESARMTSLLERADVVHLHGLWERSTHQLARRCRRIGTPYASSLRGTLDDWAMTQSPLRKRLFLRAVASRTLREAALVHCSSSGEAAQAAARLDRPPLVIPNLLRLEPLLDLPRREAVRPTILFVGRVHPSKGLDLLLRAIASLADPSLVLEVAGTGAAEPEMRSLAGSLGLADRVRFLGLLEDDALAAALQRAWAMTLPTSQENFGNALFESLAAGVPVVCTRGLDADAELRASGGAALVERTVESIAGALRSLLADAPRRRTMSDAARAWSTREMHPRVIGDRFEAMYRGMRRG